jgi:hypothetical protein
VKIYKKKDAIYERRKKQKKVGWKEQEGMKK